MENQELLEEEVAQTERIGLGDLVIVTLIAVLTAGISFLWEFPGLHPSVWSDALVAAGLRPSTAAVPGFWTAISSVIYSTFGIQHADNVLRLLGHLTLGGIAICVYGVLREWLAFAMRSRPQFSKRRTLVMRIAAAVGAAAFVLADPVWTAGQCLSETTIQLGLTLWILESFFVFLRKGTIKYAYLCAVLLGLLSAETPFGLVLTVLLVAINMFVIHVMPTMESPFFNPSVMEVGKWHMTFLFVAALIAGIGLNCWTYLSHGGVEAIGASAGDIPLRYLLDYWRILVSAGDILSWIFWIAVCILPFVVCTIKFPGCADEEQFLSYASGLIFSVGGTVALMQSASIPALWFWTYAPMESQFVLSLGLFCGTATLALAVTILGVDSLCRDHTRLSVQAFGDPSEDDDDEDDPEARRCAKLRKQAKATTSSSTSFVRVLCVIVTPIFLIGVMLPARVQTTTRQMLKLIDRVVGEIVHEAGDAKYLVTDGNLDHAIELEAARVGSPLKCYSLMGGGDPMSVYLRTRNLEDEEDLFSFKFDVAMGLRSWIRDKPEHLAQSAGLMGFDLWKRDGKPLPPMGGFLSRHTGFPSEEVRLAGVKTAHELAEEFLAFHRSGGIKRGTDPFVKRLFNAAQWRLARMCFYRGEVDDVSGHPEAAIAEAKLCKALNDCNEIYREMLSSMERRNQNMMQKLTPREGLQLALVRADFTMGKLYAETVLAADPDNPDANFAMGMYYQKEHQLSRAETYLTRCLIRKPNEPAVYNNLAMIQITLKRFDAARINIEKALKLIPDSAAVLDTKRMLEAAIEEEKNPPKPAKKRQ